MSRIRRPARELLVRMLARGSATDAPAMADLRRRGLVRQISCKIVETETSARVVEAYVLTPRGIQVAEQLTKNRMGHDLCWHA